MPAQQVGPAAAPGPMPPQAATSLPQQQQVPFVRATGTTRTSLSVQDAKTLTAAQQPITQSLPGTGYLVWVDLEMILAATGNTSSNSVAMAEDAPWSAFATITLDDGGPQMVNIDGYSLYLLNTYGGFGKRRVDLSTDTMVYSALTTGTGSAAGSGTFRLRIPAAINERDYYGLLGNQDRATKYNLRDDLSASSAIYSTAPTALPAVTINRAYAFLPVPGPQSAIGQPQQQIPDGYGIVHYMTAVKSEAIPTPGLVNHYIRNLSNAVRLFILVFRQGSGSTPRASGETGLAGGTQIDFKVGTDVIFSETNRERRQIMWDRYRWDAPSGVLVYDFLADAFPLVGYELGDDYLFLGNVSEAQFAITYNSTFTANASNGLTIITDSLYIPPNVNIYSYPFA